MCIRDSPIPIQQQARAHHVQVHLRIAGGGPGVGAVAPVSYTHLVIIQQLGHHLGVRLGAEGVALLQQLLLQSDEILDDAVVDQDVYKRQMWRVFPLPGSCLQTFWAASPARSSPEETPPWS